MKRIFFVSAVALTALLNTTCKYSNQNADNEGYDYSDNRIFTDTITMLSEDGNLSITWWDTGEGGTMVEYGNKVQYNYGGKTYTFDESEDDYYIFGACDTIYTVVGKDKTYYLINTSARYATASYTYDTYAFVIDRGKLKLIDIFKDSDESTSNLSFDCAWCEYERLTSYDANNKILIIPESGIHSRAKISGFEQYTFNGVYFELTDYLVSRYWLHPSIREFEIPSGGQNMDFDTPKFHVRIDETGDETYRYASWSKGKTVSDKPDLVIENGKATESGYVFKSGEYSYICHDGRLTVKKGRKKILEEEIISEF
jgi:hypothetical protein